MNFWINKKTHIEYVSIIKNRWYIQKRTVKNGSLIFLYAPNYQASFSVLTAILASVNRLRPDTSPNKMQDIFNLCGIYIIP